jgi:hypothetical protein
VVLRRDREQVAAVLRDERDAAGVNAVGLAAVTARQHSRAGRQRRRDIDDALPGGDELLSEQPSQAGGALDRPHPLGPG